MLQVDNNRKTLPGNMQIMENTYLQQFNPFSISEKYIILRNVRALLCMRTDLIHTHDNRTFILKGDYTDEDAMETY